MNFSCDTFKIIKNIHIIKTIYHFPENERALGAKERLNRALNERLEQVEMRKQRAVALEKKISKLPDGSEKRKLTYQKQQQEEYNRKHKKSPIDEERNYHESYQILLRVRQ